MLQSFFEGLLLGLPIVLVSFTTMFAILQTSVNKGFYSGMQLAIGISLSDILLMSLCYFGLIQYIQDRTFQIIIGFVGTAFILFYGIYTLRIGYDRSSAQYLIDSMKTEGYLLDDVWQGENLAPVIREFEGILKDGDFKIASNNLLKAHFLNVALKHNLETRKFRPVKIEQRARIDGFVSVIDAMTVRQKYYSEIGEMLKNAG